uniref:non-specific serine/threonine protein kinase n=1 Tax=Sinocyclocheilus rhinocerous TaxID=307959 RepID=A0A673LRU1_9TELE
FTAKVDDDWSEDLSLEERVSGLLEIDNDRSEDLTVEGPITSHSQVDDDWSDAIFQNLVGDLSEWSADVLHALNSVMGKFNFNSVQTPITPDCSNDVPQTTVSAMSDCSDGIPPSLCCDMSDCSVDIPQATICQTEDTVAPQLNISSRRYKIGSQLGKGGFGTIYAATCLDEGLQVSIFITYNICLANYFCPIILVSHSSLHALLVYHILTRTLDLSDLCRHNHVEPDHYILVLERPMPFEEFNWFVLRQIMPIEEDVAWVIMHQPIFAAQTCRRRITENLLINLDTLEVKLIDFAPMKHHGIGIHCCESNGIKSNSCMIMDIKLKPAAVWSLGILLFALLCGDLPKIQDLKKIYRYTWAKDECCDFIRCCLQIDPKQRIELENLCLHNWFKV